MAKKKLWIAGAVLLCALALFQVLVVMPAANKAQTDLGYSTAQESRAALARDDNDVRAHISLAEDAWRRQSYTEAAQQWREVLRVQPNDGNASIWLALSLARMGQRKEALKIYQSLAKRNDEYGDEARKFLMKIEGDPKWKVS